jgi:hypothetical protein
MQQMVRVVPQPGQMTVNYDVEHVQFVAYIHCYLLVMGKSETCRGIVT